MEQETERRAAATARIKPLYWIAAVAMAVAVGLDVTRKPLNVYSIVGRTLLVVVLVMLATAKPVESHGKKLTIYSLIAVSIALFIARFFIRP